MTKLEDAYCTLLLSDSYLPGAQVLAHSLRDGGTTKRLAVMVTLNGVSEQTIVELKKLYDYVIPVEPVCSNSAENLKLMRRPDLHSALTKIHLWKQVQFRKIVYVDADIVALRTPDELFDIEAHFAAAPDVGWPDCFNSGLMVLTPNLKTHGELTGKAERGETFDGADQGLLNQHFEEWHRLPFTYNCTVASSSMAYQYAPAFQHYGSNVSMVHFIGNQKPWDRGTIPGLSNSADAYDRLSGHWWAVWNKHHSPYGQSVGNQPQLYTPTGSSSKTQQGYTTKYASNAPAGYTAPVGNTATGSQQRGGDVPAGVKHLVQKIAETQLEGGVEVRGEAVETSIVKNPSPKKNEQREPLFVPIRSNNLPSRYDENFLPSEPPTPKDEVHQPSFTHYEEHQLNGELAEHVDTAQGRVPQKRFFKTGPDSFFVQELSYDGEPIIHSMEFDHQDQQFASWDASRYGPPQNSGPEADGLHIPSYQNEWDNMNTNKPSEFFASQTHEAELPHLKAIFPWEERQHAATRVFAGEPRTRSSSVSSGSSYSEPALDIANTDPVSPPAEERWGNYTIENKWDMDPAIRGYVAAARRRSSVPDGITVIPGADITPSPARKYNNASAGPTREHSIQTEAVEYGYIRPVYKSASTQTGSGMVDSSIQTSKVIPGGIVLSERDNDLPPIKWRKPTSTRTNFADLEIGNNLGNIGGIPTN